MSSPYLLPELVDLIVDLLHDADDALKNCSLVCKSWIPHTRQHLFANVEFRTAKDLQSWKSMFPNPSTSPAYYTRTLSITFCPDATTAGTEEGSWITTFSRVVRFEIGTHSDPASSLMSDPTKFLVPFHGFSPALKSLYVVFNALPSRCVFDFIHSFPLLEELSVATDDVFGPFGFDGRLTAVQSPSPPPFTGALKLSLKSGMDPIASRLLSLSKGPHFRKLCFTWHYIKDAFSMTALVERCSPTLEILRIDSEIFNDPFPLFVDLSKAIKLEDVAFTCSRNPRWITATLRTVTPDHRNLRQISLCYRNLYPRSDLDDPARFRVFIGDDAYQEWLELDGLLVRLCESHSIHLRVLHSGSSSAISEPGARSRIESLFPEATARGIVIDSAPFW